MTPPASPWDDPDASAAPPPPLPFVARLAICVFVLLALEGTFELWMWQQGRPEMPGVSTSPITPNLPFAIFWASWPLVVAALLLLRTAVGRVLAVTTLAVHALHLANELGVRNPDLWVYLGTPDRLKILATIALDALGVTYLVSTAARRTFGR